MTPIISKTAPIALNTPATPLPANPAAAIAVLPNGATVQAHPTIPNAFHYVTPPTGTSLKPYQPGNKYPYISGNAIVTYDIVVTRLTAAIAGSLPFMVACGDEIGNFYSDFLSAISGQFTNTPTNVAFSSGGALNFTYNSGANTDIIQVQCSQTPYSRLIKLLEQKRFKTTSTRVTLSDPSATSEFNQPIKTGIIDQESETRNKPLSYIANQSEYQYNAAKVTLNRDIYISRVEGFMSGMNAEAGLAVTFSLFVMEVAPTWTPIGQTSQNGNN